MSLAKLLESENFRSVFASRFPVPQCRFVGRMLVEPKTPDHELVNAAFAYLLGFHLKGIIPKTMSALLAEQKFDASRMTSDKYARKGIVVRKNMIQGMKGRTAEAKKTYGNAMANYERFLKGGRMPNKLLHDAMFLAKLESAYRTGNMDFSKALDIEIKDLSKLMNVAKTMDEFAGKPKCVLNPTFGKAGKLVGGNPGLLVDDTMIDVNGTNYMRLTPETWYKIVGYHVLDVMDDNRHGIRNVGIYFSRYGVLKTFSAYMFGDISGFMDRFKAKLENPVTAQA